MGTSPGRLRCGGDEPAAAPFPAIPAPARNRSPRTPSRRRARFLLRFAPRKVLVTTPPAFWQRCLDAFSAELTPQQFGTWIRPLVLEDTGSGFRLLAPNRFVLQWVKERFAGRIAELAELTEGRPVDITLGVAPAGARPPAAAAATEAPAVRGGLRAGRRARRPASAPAATAACPARRHESSSLNPDVHASPISSPARPTSSPGPRRCRSPAHRPPTTRCSSTVASASARRTSSRRSATTSSAGTRRPRSATSTPRATSPTSCAPTSTSPSTTSSATTVRSTCC